MKCIVWSLAAGLCIIAGTPVLAQVRVNPTDPQPTCIM